ncbi:TetR family transcriptional regulator [Streptomyces sp. NPDC100445]|uniref:TetR/AcrR family transcriptional regulator n=1 Tax=Streptomyces sp. NPDC100445 TaxID=3366102 RepID=UPI0037FD1B7D
MKSRGPGTCWLCQCRTARHRVSHPSEPQYAARRLGGFPASAERLMNSISRAAGGEGRHRARRIPCRSPAAPRQAEDADVRHTRSPPGRSCPPVRDRPGRRGRDLSPATADRRTNISSVTNETSRRGRRPGRPDTRRNILAVARRRFMQDGYRAVTMRSIAAEADVDLALLSYYFGSKRGLFGAALALSANPAELLAQLLREGARDTFPERVLQQVMAAWEEPESATALLAMLKGAVHDEAVTSLVKEALEGEIVARLAELVGGANAGKHAAAFSSVLAGLIITRYVLRLEPVASMSRDEVIRTFGPQLRLAIGMPIRRPARPSPHA